MGWANKCWSRAVTRYAALVSLVYVVPNTVIAARLPWLHPPGNATLPTIIVGSTGDLPTDAIEAYARHAPVYLCPNFSTGVRLLMPTLRTLGESPRYTTAVTEIHHTKKIDAPSGTAKILANALQTEQVRLDDSTVRPLPCAISW